MRDFVLLVLEIVLFLVFVSANSPAWNETSCRHFEKGESWDFQQWNRNQHSSWRNHGRKNSRLILSLQELRRQQPWERRHGPPWWNIFRLVKCQVDDFLYFSCIDRGQKGPQSFFLIHLFVVAVSYSNIQHDGEHCLIFSTKMALLFCPLGDGGARSSGFPLDLQVTHGWFVKASLSCARQESTGHRYLLPVDPKTSFRLFMMVLAYWLLQNINNNKNRAQWKKRWCYAVYYGPFSTQMNFKIQFSASRACVNHIISIPHKDRFVRPFFSFSRGALEKRTQKYLYDSCDMVGRFTV